MPPHLVRLFADDAQPESATLGVGRRLPSRCARIVARRKRSLVFLDPHEVWAIEAADRLTFVHTAHGKFDLDLSLAAFESSFAPAFVRVHRNWLVNLVRVKELESNGHESRLFIGDGVAESGRGLRVPMARDRLSEVREMLLTNAWGIRRRGHSTLLEDPEPIVAPVDED
ncbi:MAG: LytTR family DNA-binding domain-containing protein [Polyangiaceae bacterium]|jgi:DNA-binding LytR/AlgR family response regulator